MNKKKFVSVLLYSFRFKKCIEKMLGFKKNGKTIVFVSHNVEEIKRVCDRVIWIENKKIRLIDLSEKVLVEYLGEK